MMGNQLESFNLPIDKMPSLTRIGLDWFAYMLPPGQKIIERGPESASEYRALEEGQQASKPSCTSYGFHKVQKKSSACSVLDESTDGSKQSKQTGIYAGTIPSASRMPMMRVKTHSVAVY